ncbi:hypothetical protein SAMN05660865_00604 [Caloramator fervidus]|uniref:Uncharacterized protein n=1 Tax=Caloramator fervidus TaxID=29344 RepID=A0A1H5TEF5_9CLOT|nr:DUF6514 family protein [Caloramator fervidus]SEF60588.1 hypothetical protein SAMN05660865_00604 [Caloramator fervidus]
MRIKNELCHCYVVADNFKNILYRYYLVETSKLINFKDKYVNVVGYGICITSEQVKDEGNILLEEEMIEFISPYKNKVEDLIDKLAKNQVSPVHLIDVVGELCDRWVDDFEKDLNEKYIKYAIA